MAVRDLQVFLQERARLFDENLDISSGSPFDTQLVQPVLRRLGQDPFSVDLAVFIHDRLQQAFPELATDEGDAITDLLIKTAVLLWDPIVREVSLVRRGLSFKDPSTLTTDEAESLGANLVSTRDTGNTSRGPVRIYFPTPRNLSVSPANFCTSRTGLHYFPDGAQQITLEEMLLNIEGSLYYFDCDVTAEGPGTGYNIGPNEIVTIANIDGASRVTNLRRFVNGANAETAEEFVGRSKQDLTERSMVTLRGIGSRVTTSFPEATRMGVIGFGDAEMKRDVLKGGGLGSIVSSGKYANPQDDGTHHSYTRRLIVSDAGVDFTSLIGPTTVPPQGFVITLHQGFDSAPMVRDLAVTKVVSSTTVEVDSQSVKYAAVDMAWTLRQRSLTLSDIPGGILFSDNPDGSLEIPDDEVHIGSAYDVYARGTSVDESTLVLDNVTDDVPAASGVVASFPSIGTVSLGDLTVGVDYAIGDDTWQVFEDSKTYGFTLQILDGANAGSYRVVGVTQTASSSPLLDLDTAVPVVAGSFRWRLVDVLDVSLTDPKETRISGTDLKTVQNVVTVTTAGSVDFQALGAAKGDTLRILEGPDAGDYAVTSVPFFDTLSLDKALTSSNSNLKYSLFRPNSAGGLSMPFVRITKVELLDTTGQPVGTEVPYANPIDVQSRAFQNPGRGVKADISDAVLGIVTDSAPGGGFALNGLTLTIEAEDPSDLPAAVNVTFSGTISAADVASQINAAAAAALGAGTTLAVVLGNSSDRVGILPICRLRVTNGSARVVLFSDGQMRTTGDIRSATIPDWSAVSPDINEDNLDVAQALDGNQIGFYGGLLTALPTAYSTGLFSAYKGLLVGRRKSGMQEFETSAAFYPEVGIQLQVGSRSIGSVRCYFLAPTSIEFSAASYFSTTLDDGAVVRFFPDPTVAATRIPAPPSTALPKTGTSTYSDTFFVDSSADFVLAGIRVGDDLEILYVPILGSVALADPVAGLALQTLVLSVDGGGNQSITFATDVSGSPTDVSRQGVADQINKAVGTQIASIDSSNYLKFEGDVAIVVRGSGTANAALGLSTSQDVTNQSDHHGTYRVTGVSPQQLDLETTIASVTASATPETAEAYKITRPGSQRLSSTEMSSNTASAGLYYFDLELVSEGTGDLWNIVSELQLDVQEFRSDGYYLTTEDENLAFSAVERPVLHLSRSMLEVGTSDDPRNATLVSGQNVEITYDRSALIADIQNFASSETERVVCASPLARHLVPHFIRFDLEYLGGSRSDVVTQDVENYLGSLYPNELLESSDLQNLAYKRGASSVTNPIDLIAVVHNTDRSVRAQRSKDSLNTGRLAAFLPDALNITRRTS